MTDDDFKDESPPKRKAPKAVTTVEELDQLDEAAMLRGYQAGFRNSADWAESDRGYWHGYLNGMVDGGHAKISSEQALLARNIVASRRRAFIPKQTA